MTSLDDPTDTVNPSLHSGWRTPAPLYRLISSPSVRAVFGWDLPRRDVRVVPRRTGTTCLEVGSGGGFYTSALKAHLGADSNLIALDPEPGSLNILKSRLDGVPGARMSYLAGDGCTLPLADAAVDTLFYGYSLEEMADPLGAVRAAHRVLRPGGELVLFLWRPAITRARRRPILELTDQLFERRASGYGPQNIRLRYRKPA
ncbi:class I SAM-dependent methyltransferase [Streptomyces olivoreticuli]